MVLCLGLSSELKNIQQNLGGSVINFKNTDDLDSLEHLDDADLFLIGPSVEQPVKYVQKIVALDRLLSVIILADSRRYNQVKQSLHFSLFVGKNTTCLVYNAQANYAPIFQDAILRTEQRRKFRTFGAASEIKLSSLTSPDVRLNDLGPVLEHAPIGALVVDKDFKIVGANKSCRQLFKLNGAEISLSTLFPVRYLHEINDVKHENAFITVEDFKGRFYELSSSPLSDSAEPGSRILLINDITEKTEKGRTVNAILESLPQIAWTAAPEGNLNYLNHGWHAYTGKGSIEGLNDAWISVVHPDDVSSAMSHWKEATAGGKSFQQSMRLQRFDGAYRWHLVRAVPLRTKSRQITMWVGTSTDIHDQVLLTENLERKIKERTRMLEETNADLEQFAHISSHDLQEPLRKIQTFADIISNDGDSLTENARRYLDKIIRTSGGMSRLLKDLLNFTRVSEQETVETVNLNDIVQNIREDLELLLSQNNASLKSADLPVIRARPSQIRQLFYNLVNNGIKYRKSDVPPVVSITCNYLDWHLQSHHKDLPPGQYWEIIVKDNGIGFDQAYAEQIFTVFQRLHSKSAYEGTGIGLAIAKKVVVNHGGHIFANSSPGKGADFHVLLPAIA